MDNISISMRNFSSLIFKVLTEIYVSFRKQARPLTDTGVRCGATSAAKKLLKRERVDFNFSASTKGALFVVTSRHFRQIGETTLIITH